MNKEEILAKSRKELNNADLVEEQIVYQAGRVSQTVGATVCILISVLSRLMTGDYLISPWIIYFSMLGANWIVRFTKLKRKSDLVIATVFLIIAVILFVVQILQLSGVSI